MHICESKFCTGCGMCSNLCPQNAIEIKSDKKGFIRPVVNELKCVNCNLCVNRCPANTSLKGLTYNQTVYAAWNKNAEARKSSTSGGMFILLAKEIIKQGGIVCGVRWNKDFHPEHSFVEEEKELNVFKGSKYVQSITTDVYERVKKYLSAGRKVLFSGTPCQVDALNSYLNKFYENLITVDLVCHGIPSTQMFDKHLSEINDKGQKKIKNINLRYKSPSWSYGSVKIDFDDGSCYMKPTVVDAYFNLFNFNYSLRESCHYCKYANTNHQSDITLSDFWGFVPKNFKMSNYTNGISCVIVNTQAGEEIFSKIKDQCCFEKRSIDDAKRGNHCLTKPFAPPENVSEFWEDYENGVSVEELNHKYIIKPYKIPKFLGLRMIKNKFDWILKNEQFEK